MPEPRAPDPDESRDAARRDLFFNVLQVVCILIFIACVALDPELHHLPTSNTQDGTRLVPTDWDKLPGLNEPLPRAAGSSREGAT